MIAGSGSKVERELSVACVRAAANRPLSKIRSTRGIRLSCCVFFLPREFLLSVELGDHPLRGTVSSFRNADACISIHQRTAAASLDIRIGKMPSQEEYEATLAEELEVLESIYVDELEKVSAEELHIRIEPEEEVLPLLFSIGLEPGQTPTESVEDGSPSPIVLSLHIQYTSDYPDAPPNMSIHVVRDTKGILGPATEQDQEDAEDASNADRPAVAELQAGLDDVAQESLGMAMVFTLASHLRESVTTLIQRSVQEIEAAASAKREAEIEAEAEKFRGTAVTPERFAEWRVRFQQEMAEKEKKEEEAKLSKLSVREREEYKKSKVKPSGRQLFEKGGTFEEDDTAEDGAQEVDWSLYTREQREKERREQEEQEELQNRTMGSLRR